MSSRDPLRDVLAQVAMPVAIVTALDRAGNAHGLTVGSLCSLSASPPLLLVCIDRRGHSGRHIVAADRFGVSVLAAEHEHLARAFAAHGSHSFGPAFTFEDGLPAVRNALAWLACDRSEVVDGGDHHILIGRINAARHGLASPLMYHNRRYGHLDTACLSIA
ncbi:flavin reductase family protein [Dactylosporangium sp. CA-139066]|uniref:flavin reductase family protein n=1 Tax=Dactylosporangium sp. CA-139066 TaxID=3239930 RepID=UPI003D8ED42F